jgi:hypothetical protein
MITVLWLIGGWCALAIVLALIFALMRHAVDADGEE